MKFKLPFAYEVSYRHHRHWYAETVMVRSSTVVDIPEVETADGPAFEIGQVKDPRRANGTWQPFRLIDGRPSRVWRLDGLCFAEFCPVGDFEDRASQRHDNPFESAQPFPTYGTVSSYEELSAEKKVKEWYDDGGAAKAARIARRVADMRVIEGVVCVQVSEPIVVVEIGPVSVSVNLSEVLRRYQGGLWVMREYEPLLRRYRMEDFEEAERYARRTGREKGFDLPPALVVRKAEPRSPVLCQEGEHLYRTAKAVAWEMGHSACPMNGGEAASGLCKILAETPEDHSTDALADVAEALLGELRLVARDDLPFERFLELFETTRALDEDIRLWRQRPYSVDDFAARALPLPAAKPSISQILSRAALHETATALKIPIDLLEREHDLGNLLVRYFDEVQVVAVITHALSVKSFYGKYGRMVAVDEETFDGFLAENVARRAIGSDDDAIAFASLSFD